MCGVRVREHQPGGAARGRGGGGARGGACARLQAASLVRGQRPREKVARRAAVSGREGHGEDKEEEGDPLEGAPLDEATARGWRGHGGLWARVGGLGGGAFHWSIST